MAKKIASVDREICVACGACAKECPKQAIGVYKGCYAAVKAPDEETLWGKVAELDEETTSKLKEVLDIK